MRFARYGVFLFALGVAYFLGYFPERQRVAQLRKDLQSADRDLAEVRGRLRVSQLEFQLVQVLDDLARQQFDAADSSLNTFSVSLRSNLARPDMKRFETPLSQVAEKLSDLFQRIRDKDPLARDMVRSLMKDLGQIATPPEPSALPAVLRAPEPSSP
jgi:hypothetical protein